MAQTGHAAWVACLVLCLSGCVTRGALVAPSLTPDARSAVELTATPFFPQRKFQCGPAALATVLGASNVNALPDELEPLVYLLTKRGSLQIEMQAAPRKYARLSYPLDSELAAIVAELNAGRPALALHNYGLPFWPRWHYAVVIGYDSQSDTVTLRSGTTRRQVLSARNFMRVWDNGGRWAMVLLRPGELPANANRTRYLEAAAAFERVAQPKDAALAFETALQRWPDEPIAWIGRGTAHYRSGELGIAARDYAEALRLDPTQTGARNNLAMTLLDLNCVQLAREQLEKIDTAQLTSPLLEAVADTRAQIDARASALSAESCRLRPTL